MEYLNNPTQIKEIIAVVENLPTKKLHEPISQKDNQKQANAAIGKVDNISQFVFGGSYYLAIKT